MHCWRVTQKHLLESSVSFQHNHAWALINVVYFAEVKLFVDLLGIHVELVDHVLLDHEKVICSIQGQGAKYRLVESGKQAQNKDVLCNRASRRTPVQRFAASRRTGMSFRRAARSAAPAFRILSTSNFVCFRRSRISVMEASASASSACTNHTKYANARDFGRGLQREYAPSFSRASALLQSRRWLLPALLAPTFAAGLGAPRAESPRWFVSCGALPASSHVLPLERPNRMCLSQPCLR